MEDLESILKKAGIPVAHYEITGEHPPPYIVYQETKTDYTYASGAPIRENIKVLAMHFTSKRFDPSLEKLKQALFDAKILFSIDHDYNEKIVMSMFTITLNKDL